MLKFRKAHMGDDCDQCNRAAVLAVPYGEEGTFQNRCLTHAREMLDDSRFEIREARRTIKEHEADIRESKSDMRIYEREARAIEKILAESKPKS